MSGLKYNWIDTMAATLLAFSDLVIDTFFGTDPDQDAKSLIQLIVREIIFAPGVADAGKLANYTFLKNVCFFL